MILDVDFPADPNYVFGYEGPGDTSKFARYEDEAEVYPESKWLEMAAAITDENGLDSLVTRIFDQGQEGSCVGNAATQANQILQAIQFGKDRVIQMSAVSLYQLIGRSPSSGANVGDSWDKMNEVGILPLDTEENKARFKHTMPHRGFYTDRPAGCEETAKMFRGCEALQINSLAELVSAQFNGHPVVVGRSGHSILYLRPMNKDGQLVDKYANSWKPSWGDHGFGYDSRSMMQSASRGAYALRSITVPKFQS